MLPCLESPIKITKTDTGTEMDYGCCVMRFLILSVDCGSLLPLFISHSLLWRESNGEGWHRSATAECSMR